MFTQSRLRAAAVAMFPTTLAIGIMLIPVVSDYSEHAAAEQAVRHSMRWGWGHILSAIGFSLGVLAAFAMHDWLQSAGDESGSVIALPFMAVGAALHAAGLGADGVGPIAVIRAGRASELYFNGSTPWIVGLFAAGSVTFGFGLILLMVGIVRQRMLPRVLSWVVLFASVVFVAAAAIPSGWGLYVVAVDGLVSMLRVAYQMWISA